VTSRPLLVRGDEALVQAEARGLGAVGELQLGQDAGHVRLHGLLADLNGPGDLAVGAAAGPGGEHLQLTGELVERPAAADEPPHERLLGFAGGP
jgi:hypothetical protein